MRVPRPSAIRTVALLAVAAAATVGLVEPRERGPGQAVGRQQWPGRHPPGPARHRPGVGHHPRPAEGDGPRPALVGRADPVLPEPDRARSTRRLHAVLAVNPDALRIAAASDQQRRRHGAPLAAGGHPDPAQGQRRHPGQAADHRRLVRAAGQPGAGKDAFLVQRSCALAGAVIIGKANLSEWANFRSTNSTQRLVRRRRPDQQPVRAGPQPVRLVLRLRRRRRGQPGHRRDRHRDRRLDRLPVRAERRGRHQADARPGQPVRRGADLGRAGHRRPDRQARRGRGADPRRCCAAIDPTRRRDRRRRAVPERRPAQGPEPGRACGASGSGCGSPAPAPTARPETLAVLNQARAALTRLGATVVDDRPAVPGRDRRGRSSPRCWNTSSSTTSTPTWPPGPGTHPKDLAGLIAFNNAHAAERAAVLRPGDLRAGAGDVRRPDRPGVPAAAGDRDRAGRGGASTRRSRRLPPGRDHGRRRTARRG